jgi:hypothetical protein
MCEIKEGFKVCTVEPHGGLWSAVVPHDKVQHERIVRYGPGWTHRPDGGGALCVFPDRERALRFATDGRWAGGAYIFAFSCSYVPSRSKWAYWEGNVLTCLEATPGTVFADAVYLKGPVR